MSSLTGHCINTVVFAGDKEQEILEYFNQMEEHSPPFLSIMVYDNALHFDSRWIPPIRSLTEIAEQFDVSYKIDFRVPYEDRGTYSYTCLQQQPLSPRLTCYGHLSMLPKTRNSFPKRKLISHAMSLLKV